MRQAWSGLHSARLDIGVARVGVVCGCVRFSVLTFVLCVLCVLSVVLCVVDDSLIYPWRLPPS